MIDRALEMLHERDEWLTANPREIDAKIRAGMAELERGEGIPEDELDAYLGKAKSGAKMNRRYCPDAPSSPEPR